MKKYNNDNNNNNNNINDDSDGRDEDDEDDDKLMKIMMTEFSGNVNHDFYYKFLSFIDKKCIPLSLNVVRKVYIYACIMYLEHLNNLCSDSVHKFSIAMPYVGTPKKLNVRLVRRAWFDSWLMDKVSISDCVLVSMSVSVPVISALVFALSVVVYMWSWSCCGGLDLEFGHLLGLGFWVSLGLRFGLGFWFGLGVGP